MAKAAAAQTTDPGLDQAEEGWAAGEIARLRAELARERAAKDAALAALAERDHGEQERTEALRESVSRLSEADRRKDEFLAMLAHELRNPLAPILMAIELLRVRLPAPPETERLRDIIERQTRQLARLVDDLLEVSRFTLDKIRLDKHAVLAQAVVARAVETSRPLIDARRHALTIDAPDEPLSIEADPVRLAQVIGNLLNNAAKYTEEGGKIHVGIARDGDDVLIRVADDGVGIPAEMLGAVFDLFAQSDRSLDRAQGGLGIGLTLARRIMQMHGGTLTAESAGAGLGSVFTARLGALLGPAEDAPALSTRRERTEAPRSTPLRALVVDDNIDAADMLSSLLASLGHDVRVAHDGVEALEEAARHAPEIVLLDIGLPRMDGLEVARRMREDGGRSAELVAVTGYGHDEDRRRSEEAGFDHHLVKPIDLGVLEALLVRVLERRKPATRE
jgi:signal transduction histidine kinase/ActR/RegA family two-component response regulator